MIQQEAIAKFDNGMFILSLSDVGAAIQFAVDNSGFVKIPTDVHNLLSDIVAYLSELGEKRC